MTLPIIPGLLPLGAISALAGMRPKEEVHVIITMSQYQHFLNTEKREAFLIKKLTRLQKSKKKKREGQG